MVQRTLPSLHHLRLHFQQLGPAHTPMQAHSDVCIPRTATFGLSRHASKQSEWKEWCAKASSLRRPTHLWCSRASTLRPHSPRKPSLLVSRLPRLRRYSLACST